jgi:hypothetical protein
MVFKGTNDVIILGHQFEICAALVNRTHPIETSFHIPTSLLEYVHPIETKEVALGETDAMHTQFLKTPENFFISPC